MKRPFYLIINAFLIVFLISCHSIIKHSSDNSVLNEIDYLLKIHTTGCEGYCSIYEIVINENKLLKFNGLGNTKIIGIVEIKLGEEIYKKLSQLVKSNNVCLLSNNYIGKNIEGPSKIFTYKCNNQVKTVITRGKLPESLSEINELIDNILNENQFK